MTIDHIPIQPKPTMRFAIGQRLKRDGHEFMIVGITMQQSALVKELIDQEANTFYYVVENVMPSVAQYAITRLSLTAAEVFQHKPKEYSPMFVVDEGPDLDLFEVVA